MWSYFTSITSISSVHTASPSSSSWVVVPPPRPQNILRMRTARSSPSIWSNPPVQVLLETSSWRPSAQVRILGQAAALASPTLWASRCHPRNDRTRDKLHPLSNKTWHSLTSSAMGYPSAGHAAGRISQIHTFYATTHELIRTFTSTIASL
jgi:hypothetical protein